MLRRRLLGEEHLDVATSLKDWGEVLQQMQDLEAAESHYLACLNIRRKHLPANHPQIASIQYQLAGVQMLRRDYPAAEAALRQAFAIWRERYGGEHRRTTRAARELGACLTARAQFAEAETLLLATYSILERKPLTPADQDDLREIAVRIITLYDAWNKPQQAGAWRARTAPHFPASGESPRE